MPFLGVEKKKLLKAIYVTIAALRNSYDLIVQFMPWFISHVTFECKNVDVEKEERWYTLLGCDPNDASDLALFNAEPVGEKLFAIKNGWMERLRMR